MTRASSLFRRAPLLLLAAALVALAVFFVHDSQPAAASHEETIWSATLTADQGSSTYFGCSNSFGPLDNCSSSTALTEDEFRHGGATYTLDAVWWRSNEDRLYFNIENVLGEAAKTALANLTLNVDGTALAISDATVDTGVLYWTYDPDPDWTDGRTVELSLTRPAYSADLDPAFGTGGKVTTPFNTKASEIYGVAKQSDGKIVAVGWVQTAANNKDFALARYNADGSLDTAFGTGGRVSTDIGAGNNDEARAVAIQPDGKIVVAGYANDGDATNPLNDFALARYNTDGSLDTGFGTIDGVNRTGKLTTSLAATDIAHAVAIQSDGKIVLAGQAGNSFGVARYHPAGDPDEDTTTPAYTGFAGNGRQTTDFTAGVADRAHAVAIQSDGKIVLAGYATNNNGTTSVTTDDHKDFALARYTTAGALDSAFDTDGKVTTAISSTTDDEINDIALDGDGKIVAAGYAHVGTYHEVALARYTETGALDSSFDTNGSVVTQSIGALTDVANSVAIDSDGNIVVAGYSYDSSTGNDFMVARYTSAGALDTAFNTSGSVTTPIGDGDDTARAVVIADDGSIIAAGYSHNGSVHDFALARYLEEPVSNDADLSGLTASTSTSASGTFSGLTLSPSIFAAATTAYTASVANTVTHAKITPTTNDSNATVEVGLEGQSLTAVTSGSASGAIALAAGANAITVKVTAEDGTTTKTYTVTVTRAGSSDADLSGLTVSAVAQGTFPPLTLDPETFAAATTEYTATVANTVEAVRVTPTTSDSNATVEVGLEGQSLTTVTSGQANDEFISLSVGANAITVKVTAQDGSTTKTYTVTVTREEAQHNPAPTGLTVRRGDGRLDLSWNPPPASVGTVGNYEVEYTSSATVSNADVADIANKDPAAGWVVALSLNANSVTPSHPITGLTSGTVYRVRVRYHLSDFTPSYWAYATGTPVGPDVSKWNPTVFVQELGGDRYGCRSGVTVSAMPGRPGGAECSELANFDGNEFSVSHVRFGTRGYRVLDLYIEPHRSTSWGETAYRVVFRVDDDSGTAELGRGMTLVLTTPGVTEKRLPFNAAERDGNTFRWPLLFEDGALGWDQGWVRGVKVRIHQFTAGLDYVRVHYDEMRNGQPVNGFGAWLPAEVSAYFPDGLVAYIPGQFRSSDPEQGMLTTTHAKLWVGPSHLGSTLEWAGGNVNGVTGSFAALGADELTPAIELNPASKWTYVYVRVTNGSQVATHTIAIDPPPRTYSLTPQARVAEGAEATLSLSLGSPAGAGGVSFTVSADYPDGGATAEDVGQFATAVTVPEGQQSARIIIPTVDDEAIEEDEERFTVRVAHAGEPAWAVDPEGTATAVVTIEDNDEPPEGPEPWNIRVVPGDGALTVTWNVGARAGVEDSEIRHALRWSQEPGYAKWNNPRDPRAVGRNDGVHVPPGENRYVITGLENGVTAGVMVRSFTGHRNNMSERDPTSSKWVHVRGEHTTPVAGPNAAPTVSAAIADATIVSESGTKEVSLAGVFSDADGDELTITATSSDDAVATVSVSADYSTLTVTAQSRGTVTITVNASDGNGGTVDDSFAVTVKAAPVVASAIADIGGLEAGNSRAVSLSGVFSDADGDSLTVTAASSNKGKATVSVDADQSRLTVSGVAEGKATITVTAQDANGNTVSDAFDVTVAAPPNNAPTVSGAIADAAIVNESGTHETSLSGVFDDDDDLTVTAASSAESVATVAVAADYSTLTVSAKSRGTATVTVTASDGNGGSVEDSFTVTVKAAPVVASAIADVSELEVDATHQVSMSGVFSDPDGDAVTVTEASSSDSAVAAVSAAIDGSTSAITSITVTGVSEGTVTITVTAKDSDGNTVSEAFDVTVNAPAAQQQVNNAPTVSAAISDATIVNETGTHRVALSGVFADADGDDLTVTASSSDESVATVAVSADYSTLTVSARSRGTATVTVTATDGYGGTVEDAFTVRVKAAPVVASAIADVSSLEEGSTRDIALSGVFRDADGDSLTISAASSNEATATVSVASERSALTVSGVSEGTATITVTARDTDGNTVSDAFEVSVARAPEPEPDPVELPGPVGNLQLTATHDSVSVSWSAPESGDAPDGYIVNIKRQGGGDGETRRPGANKTALTFRDLNGGSTYEVWVRAQNEAGKGERVRASVTLPSVLPGPVTGLEVAATEDGVTVSWSAPETGGAPDGYIVHIRPEGGAEGSGRTKTPRAKKTKVTFENLEAGRTYKVWVRAENEAGKGERVHAGITIPAAQ